MKTETKVRIRQFLTQTFKNDSLEDHTDIFAIGPVNSLFAMQLILFVEQQFHLSIENEDLELDNFRTIDALANLIERKQAATPQIM